ncbi:MAG: response regulator [Daejeonella sp.]
MLGDMDGREVCKTLKSDPQTSHIPVIMISASHNLFNAQEKKCLADDFIAKPFDIDHLATIVNQHVY